MKLTRLLLQITLPVVILVVAIALSVTIVQSRELPEAVARESKPPIVQAIEIRPQQLRLEVEALGMVSPRTETLLISEVAGRIEELSPGLASGGFFSEGELLLRIDDTDYIAAVEEATAAVARAEAALAREEADAEVARKDWDLVSEGREATPLALRVPQLKEARANLASAKARLEMARRDVERTKIRAPYAGRVRSRRIDVGQFVPMGTALAEIFAVDFAEVRLPIPHNELPMLDLALNHDFNTEGKGPHVALSAQFAGSLRKWSGNVERAEGAIDSKTQSVVLVVRVDDPYGRKSEGTSTPLLAGMYVDASIDGKFLEEALLIPRTAVRTGEKVLVVNAEDRLEIRPIELFASQGDHVVVNEGLEPGDRVIITPLELPVPGMPLRVEDTEQ